MVPEDPEVPAGPVVQVVNKWGSGTEPDLAAEVLLTIPRGNMLPNLPIIPRKCKVLPGTWLLLKGSRAVLDKVLEVLKEDPLEILNKRFKI